ncbi:RHS repeat domain-containing protein [Chryseobacterium paridis]|uniref:RHS repeat-associated core domain-containing protein n=1 Tax=Chryseobacterium paridis TaxID=2800328 RepID=A0ABS1FW63_9FLAO|nr:RHS repeat-associated core domain-containing protein [Chryseobacterium paridis]MBK1896676.1 RHS repeat-associated core domain-containing protein [Chryseobacterium paridis]
MRLSYLKNTTGAVEILDSNDYYPFGMNHLKTGNAFFGPSSFKNYKYNGKELQETGFVSMDFRHYAPDIGRFVSQDRISEIMPNLTPYRFAFNNPVYFSDPTGLFEKGNNVLAYPERPGTEKREKWVDNDGTFTWNGNMWIDNNGAGISYKEGQIEEVSVGTSKSSSSSSYAGIENDISSSIWLTNTAVGATSAYTVYRGQYHLSNELWRYQPNGKQKIITPWNKMKNGKNYWNNNFAKTARLSQLEKVKNIRNISSKLTKAGGILLGADIILSGEIKPSHFVNGFMLGLSTSGVGSIVAGAWFIADFGTMGANYLINGEAKGLGDMLDESIGTYEIYDGIY